MSFGTDSDDLQALAAAQRRELLAAEAMESDFEFAFHLQLQEALNASLSLQPSTSTDPPATPPGHKPSSSAAAADGESLSYTAAQSQELLKFQQELDDQKLSVTEFKKIRDDLHRRIHDQKFAEEIMRIPEDEWEDWGGDFERPFGEGSSKSVNAEVFRVYFKGLIEKCGTKHVLGGIGVAICNSSDQLLFELSKPLLGSEFNRHCVEFKALIEGLNAAISLELKRVVFYCDYRPIYRFVTGHWSPKQRKVAALVNQVNALRGKFVVCNPSFVARNEIKYVFKSAREALDSQVKKQAESTASRVVHETCVICLEDVEAVEIFSVDGCMHRYCISCMKQHIEVKLLHGVVPVCPHEGCNSELRIDSCKKILTPKLINILYQRIKEASIPDGEKVYCPYPKCSELMSKDEVWEYSRRAVVGSILINGARMCTKCKNQFCINCKVPWHDNMSCNEYKRSHPSPPEDVKLKSLAAKNLWRQCVKCNHMIELAAGCYHMTCRCGYEFCYTCGAEWKEKKPTCTCPLWDEDYIIDSNEDDDDDEDDYYDDDDEEDFGSESDYDDVDYW
ncbi:PREDICTED: uncharacterized protein LOC109188733 [Ipomoea nil]|uniref:uncharacterized protein LOC109188733 n=1 Tax=Ipomoea nil TaxID=35883 RepID=UPI000901CEE8|nr:PREDICTED: uncharacterized protein LOC109188733 [Ipomoea nil]XP_019194898.1 PREDICTED: uncharacterized protein LOC109188733 [Ipomoea nil]